MLNLLLLCVPIAVVLAATGASPTLVFLASGLAIVPLAAWLSQATEALAARSGATLGGLLNATFGNATELIIAGFALAAGQIEVVKASLIGSIIGNILLVLGLAAFLGGLRYQQLSYNVEQVKVLSSMLVIAMIGFVVPAVFDLHERMSPAISDGAARVSDAQMSLGVAVVLVALYLGNLVFSFGSHKDIMSTADEGEPSVDWGRPKAVAVLLGATALIAVMSELLVGALEGFTEAIGLSASFVGLVIIPIVGNAAEHATAVVVARKNKMDLAVTIALGSALQIALVVAPALIFLSWALGRPTDLVLRGPLELTALIGSVLIGSSVARDGEMNWYEGLMLLGVYIILALAFFFSPPV